MNRMLAEADLHRVLEGLITAAYAMKAVKDARCYGLLGRNISYSDFDVEVARSAGAFVCGKETAMLAAIEGGRAMPRQRPPYPATYGLFDKPTVINNVELLLM
ncbi:MAG: hypothetical protein QW374_03940 [Candidatus Bathyarchaeia archaeon]|nr:hypothetical protein [Candidatus Bathyarchaeota archaeon]